jgi:hypothetical protein
LPVRSISTVMPFGTEATTWALAMTATASLQVWVAIRTPALCASAAACRAA